MINTKRKLQESVYRVMHTHIADKNIVLKEVGVKSYKMYSKTTHIRYDPLNYNKIQLLKTSSKTIHVYIAWYYIELRECNLLSVAPLILSIETITLVKTIASSMPR